MYEKRRLSNGVRVVSERMESVKSVSIGVWVKVGSRDEADPERGLSHFLEHMFFKGTARRSAREIAREIDGLGGELNAFTSREGTTLYTKVLDQHLPQAVEVLADIFLNSVFDKKEIEKEKSIVLEEIKMVEDDPEDLVHDLHTERFWEGHPLGRPILGTVETVTGLTRDRIVEFLRRHYEPSRVVIAVSGRFDPASLLALLERAFGGFGNGAARRTRPAQQPPRNTPATYLRRKSLEQIHLCIGAAGLPQDHPERYALYALNTLLGGGVSSRLFQEVRENRGWAYAIYSSIAAYRDAGLCSIYAATSPQNAGKVVRAVLKEVKALRKDGPDSEELRRAKEHMKGSLMLSLESTSSRMSRLAKDEIYFGRYIPLEEVISRIDEVSPEGVRKLAGELFDRRGLALTALGPLAKASLPRTLSA